jgi:hypothetical protein
VTVLAALSSAHRLTTALPPAACHLSLHRSAGIFVGGEDDPVKGGWVQAEGGSSRVWWLGVVKPVFEQSLS